MIIILVKTCFLLILFIAVMVAINSVRDQRYPHSLRVFLGGVILLTLILIGITVITFVYNLQL